MALITYILPTQPSGHSDGFVAYKQGDNLAMRSHARPTIVRSNAANVGRWLIAELSLYWEHPLTDAQRIAWGNYGFNTPLTNAYNAPRYIKGYAHYMRSNRPRLQMGIARIDDGPTTMGLPTYTLPIFSVMFPTATIGITINPADDWANQDNAAMLIWGGIARSIATTKPTETYRPVGKILGSTSGISASYTLPFPSNFPTRPVNVWLRSSVTDEEGRLSGL